MNLQNKNDKYSGIVFYKPFFDKDGNFKHLEIYRTGLLKLLKNLGFSRYKKGDEYIIVHIKDNKLTKVSKEELIDILEEYINTNVPDKQCFKPDDKTSDADQSNEVNKEDTDPENEKYFLYRKQIYEKILKGLDTFFSTSMLNRLRIGRNLVINRDAKEEIFFYFRNGFVSCTKSGWKLKPYTELQNYIWSTQIIDKDFNYYGDFLESEDESKKAVFAKFMSRISGDSARFDTLCTITGYLIHQYYDAKLKAIILTDSQVSDNAEGRTGKTLYGKGTSMVRQVDEINGKNFNHSDKHRYSQCREGTDIVHVNDICENIQFKVFYNDITEGIVVDKKNIQPFTIKAKLLLSTNATIEIQGASDRDRSIEFEFADHYSDTFSPADEFGHWFFKDWDDDEWNKYFNFICCCCKSYLASGIIAAKTINLNHRKLRKQTCMEFIDFMEDENFQQVVEGVELLQPEKLIYNHKYNVKTLITRFKTLYPDYNYLEQRLFNKWLKLYAEFNEGFEPFNENSDWYKSNGNYYIAFRERIAAK